MSVWYSYYIIPKKNTYFRTYIPTENNAMTPDNFSRPIFLTHEQHREATTVI